VLLELKKLAISPGCERSSEIIGGLDVVEPNASAS